MRRKRFINFSYVGWCVKCEWKICTYINFYTLLRYLRCDLFIKKKERFIFDWFMFWTFLSLFNSMPLSSPTSFIYNQEKTGAQITSFQCFFTIPKSTNKNEMICLNFGTKKLFFFSFNLPIIFLLFSATFIYELRNICIKLGSCYGK